MADFHMNRAYNKGTRAKTVKKVSNFEDRTNSVVDFNQVGVISG